MSASKGINVTTLIAHLDKQIVLLDGCLKEIVGAQNEDLPLLGRTSRAAVLMAGLLENYYTCAETTFVRISQFFENDLPARRWHTELLSRMTLEIRPLRPRVISDVTHADLEELKRFRHFRRYYFGTAYDWDRIDALIIRALRVHSNLIAELHEFVVFLRELNI